MKTILKNKYFWISVVAGLVIGDILGVVFFADRTPREIPVSASSVSGTTSSPYLLRVKDQSAGQSVFVSGVQTAATSTWLAVREENGGLLGRILGARRIDATFVSDLEIGLLRPTAPHVMYAIVMYEDDGDKEFNHTADTLVRKGDSILTYPFTAY